MEKTNCKDCGGEIVKNENGAFECLNCGRLYSEDEISAFSADKLEDESVEPDVSAEDELAEQSAKSADDSKTKKTNKTIAIVTLCGIVLAFFIAIAAASSGENRTASSSENEYDNPVYTYTTVTDNRMTEDEFIEHLEEVWGHNSDVKTEIELVEPKIFSLKMTVYGTSVTVGKIMAGVLDRSAWTEVKSSINQMYNTIRTDADNCGFEDYTVSISVLNDYDTSKTFLLYSNGVFLYDVLA